MSPSPGDRREPDPLGDPSGSDSLAPQAPAADDGSSRTRLSSGRLLARNTVVNIGGSVATMAVAILAIPILINGLGLDRFGVLTLAWIVIGYSGIFDLGLGRALTKLTSEKIGIGREDEIPPLFWTALAVMFCLGLVAAGAVALLAPVLVGRLLKIPDALEVESLYAFYVLAMSIPVVICSAGLRGSLEARQRFELTNAVAVPMTALSYIGPIVTLAFGANLVYVVGAVVASRVIAFAIYLSLNLRVDPALARARRVTRSAIDPLLRYGGWVTVSNIFTPLLTSIDRFVIGAFISTTAVAYYATPYEAVGKLRIVSQNLSSVFFPAFALNLAHDDRRSVLFGRGSRFIFVTLFPLALVIVVFAEEILALWLGADFARNSEHVMQWLTIGVLVNSLAQLAYGFVQSQRPDLHAKLSVAELPVFLLVFVLLIRTYGIEGAALAWTGRVAIDAAILYGIVWWLSPASAPGVRRIYWMAGSAIAVLVVASLLAGIALKLSFLAVALALFAVASWRLVLEVDERLVLGDRLLQLARSARLTRRRPTKA